MVMCPFLLVPVFNLIGSIRNQSFEFKTFLLIAIGLCVCLVVATTDYFKSEKIKDLLGKIDLKKVGDGNLVLIDEYNGWSRQTKIRGTVDHHEIILNYRYGRGLWRTAYLNFYSSRYNNQYETDIKIDGTLTAEGVNNMIRSYDYEETPSI